MTSCRAICRECQRKPVRIVQSIDGRIKYGTVCEGCKSRKANGLVGPCGDKRIGGKHSKSYKEQRKDYCERCQFIPENLGQLDVDHIDGNHCNHSPSNLQTLCSNCHRLKTIQERSGPFDNASFMRMSYVIEDQRKHISKPPGGAGLDTTPTAPHEGT